MRQAIDKNLKEIGDTAIRNYDKWKEFRVQMDIDTAGLPFLKNLNPPAGSKSVKEMREIRDHYSKYVVTLDELAVGNINGVNISSICSKCCC